MNKTEKKIPRAGYDPAVADWRYANRNNLDITRFAAMDTEEEAYWLGFLYTDGYMLPDCRGVVISLAASDKAHVQRFADWLGWKRPVREYCHKPPSGVVASQDREQGRISSQPRSTARASINNTVIAANLARVGMHCGKTWTVRPWEGPAHLMQHFWRGCVDGDGGMGYSVPGRKSKKSPNWKNACITFSGNQMMVDGFQDYIADRIGRKGTRQVRAPLGARALAAGYQFHVVSWAGNLACKAIVELLYRDCVVALDRKLTLAREMMAHVDTAKLRHVTRDEILSLYATHGNWCAAGRAVGAHNTGLTYHAKRHGITKADLDAARRNYLALKCERS